ncbi:MAG: hypothetical protein QOG35_1619 [Solirubrobacteraceae bacterium]|jgi:hypothetical protein|nr:hypothetical protein [Solirubrobacteraceae bacterium]
MFEVEYTDEFEAWWNTLAIEQQVAVDARVQLLAQRGPALKRPVVGEIKGSSYDPHMKELVVEASGSLRILFIFDPRRAAILLLGGDKTGLWNQWYATAIPDADKLYEQYLKELADEGSL